MSPMIFNTRLSRLQRGVTLIELMVGIAIGLLVVAVAVSVLMISRGVSGTVSDSSTIQEQAAYALRMIGSQLRPAGSMSLNLNSGNAAAGNLTLAPVAFEATATSTDPSVLSYDTNQAAQQLSGTATTLAAGYSRNLVNAFSSATPTSFARNCQNGPADDVADLRIESIFSLDTTDNELQCSSTNSGGVVTVQPIINNVANFQVRYLLQASSAIGAPTIRYADAAAVGGNWGRVQGVEVCLVLYGDEAISMPAGTAYTDCDGSTMVDMTTLSGIRQNRMHMVFRNVFQLRSQGSN
jgi:type IV pilus assembly protein PilW